MFLSRVVGNTFVYMTSVRDDRSDHAGLSLVSITDGGLRRTGSQRKRDPNKKMWVHSVCESSVDPAEWVLGK